LSWSELGRFVTTLKRSPRLEVMVPPRVWSPKTSSGDHDSGQWKFPLPRRR
jgi:hypothetical protein